MIHLVEAKTQLPSVRISRLQQSLGGLLVDQIGLRVHLGVLLAEALYENGDIGLAIEELGELKKAPLSACNPERQLWAEYYLLRFGGSLGPEKLVVADDLLLRSHQHGDRYAALLCNFLIVEINIATNNVDVYRGNLQKLLEQRYVNSFWGFEATI